MAKFRTGFHCLVFQQGPSLGQAHDVPPEWRLAPRDGIPASDVDRPNVFARWQFKTLVANIVDDGFANPVKAVLLVKVEDNRTLTVHRALLVAEGEVVQSMSRLIPEPELLLALCDCGSFGTQPYRGATCLLQPMEQPL